MDNKMVFIRCVFLSENYDTTKLREYLKSNDEILHHSIITLDEYGEYKIVKPSKIQQNYSIEDALFQNFLKWKIDSGYAYMSFESIKKHLGIN